MGDEAPAESEAPPPAEEPPPAEAPAEVAPEGEVAAPEEPAPPADSAEQRAGEEPPKEEDEAKPEDGQEAAEGGAGEVGEAPAEGEHDEAQAEGVTEEGPAEGEAVAEAPIENEAEGVVEGEEKPKEEEPVEPVEAAEVEDDDDDFLDEDEDFRRVSDISGIGKHDDKDGKRKSMDKKKTRAMGSIISIRRGNMEYFDRQKVPKYMNSYKLESDKPFNVEVVENILKEVLIEALEDLNYDEEKVPKQAKWASSAIRAKVKEQEYDRYKIVCMVTIGEKRSQDVFYLFRMLWDVDRDKYARFTHENMYLFAVALCFGLYYE